MESGTAIQMKCGVVADCGNNPMDDEGGLGKVSHWQEKGSLGEYKANQLLRFEHDWDSKGKEELNKVEVDNSFKSLAW